MHLENANLEQLVRHIASTVTNLSQVDRKRIVAIAIGRAISLSLPLPAQALTSTPEAFYDLNHVESVGNAVSKINELYPLDVGLTIDVARMYFTFRYNVVYNPKTFSQLMDRIMVWSDDILPERVRDLAQQALARGDFNSDVERLVQLAQLTVFA
jgi:hypothetical protein